MHVFRAVWRSFLLLGYFLRFGTELLVYRYQDRRARADWLHRFCATAVRGLNLNVTVEGTFPPAGSVISNHQSYVDIVLFAALHPCVFCAKAEIRRWPVIGWMTEMAGTVFVERGRGGSAVRAKSGMEAAANAGLPVVFFPEGKTTDGTVLLPFHSGLLAQAMAAGQPVTPAFVRYTVDAANGSTSSAARDVAWGDETPLVVHAFRFLGLRGVQARVVFAGVPMQLSSEVRERKVAAIQARTAVEALGREEVRA